ncbi:MAG TPA: hypothetical protein VF261_02885 [Candidatus Saccharimonadales bacterium]
MQSFIVLGIIPGTHIQINFTIWLVGTSVFACVAAALFGKRVLEGWLLGLYLLRIIHRRDIHDLAL